MAKLTVEIADTPALLAQGLMFRRDLPSDHGMLFKFPRVIEMSFWGKNTYLPLDIAFVDEQNKIAAIKSIVPMSTRTVRSDRDCIMAIEANAGFFDKHGISTGAQIELIKEQDLYQVIFKNA